MLDVRGADISFRRWDINRLFCTPTTDVISILIANPIAKLVSNLRSFSFGGLQLAPALV